MKEQAQQVTMKDPKKVKHGKRLAEHNRRKREERALLAKARSESNITYYGTGAVIVIGALAIIGYYVHQSKTPKDQPKESPVH